MTTTAITRPGRPTRVETQQKKSVKKQRASGIVSHRRTLPEYLLPGEVEALIAEAPNADCSLGMMLGWRAGLRVSEALGVEVANLYMDDSPPTVKVMGKGSKERHVPLHPELVSVIRNHLLYGRIRSGKLVRAGTRTTHWKWYQQALAAAQARGAVAAGRKIGTHSLRHSAARHWLASGVPINQVQRWLGHASLQTTLVYLEIIPDPGNYMERVP